MKRKRGRKGGSDGGREGGREGYNLNIKRHTGNKLDTARGQ